MDERERQRQFEQQFIAQLQARALMLTRRALPADAVVCERTGEGLEEVRDALRRLEVYDRDALERLPGTDAVQFSFRRNRMGGLWRETVARLRARVCAPLDALILGQEPRPVGREQVLGALARYQLLPRGQQPSGVVLASPTGFTPEAQRLVETGGRPTLVLMGQRPDGGWDVHMSEATRRTPWARLFDFETQGDRQRRLMYHLEQDQALLDSRGIPIRELAEKLGVSRAETEGLVRQACRTEPRLMTVVHNGQVHLCRSPLDDRGETMGIWTRIRKLLRLKPTVTERVRDMTAQRVRLEQARHELDKSIDKLEADERRCLEQGAAAASPAERKQVAQRLMRVRRDLGRVRSQASVYTQQLDILGTHIHHLTLTEKGRRLELPKAEELTREAAAAEAVMAELSANADLARGIEVRGESPMMVEEEQAIMAEFESMAASGAGKAAEKPAERAGADAARAPAESERQRSGEPPSATRPPAQRDPAKPEMG